MVAERWSSRVVDRLRIGELLPRDLRLDEASLGVPNRAGSAHGSRQAQSVPSNRSAMFPAELDALALSGRTGAM